MTIPYKPENYSTVSPYLVLDGAADTIDFLKHVFDAQELRRFPAENGGLMHAEVCIEDTVLMLADAAGGWPAIPAHVHIYVSDVDETFGRAVAAGGIPVQEPQKKEDADRRGAVRGPGGATWWMATKVE